HAVAVATSVEPVRTLAERPWTRAGERAECGVAARCASGPWLALERRRDAPARAWHGRNAAPGAAVALRDEPGSRQCTYRGSPLRRSWPLRPDGRPVGYLCWSCIGQSPVT